MAGKGGSAAATMVSHVKSTMTFIALCGLALAVLQVFNGDPLEAISWAGEWLWTSIKYVAAWLVSFEWFHQIFENPSS